MTNPARFGDRRTDCATPAIIEINHGAFRCTNQATGLFGRPRSRRPLLASKAGALPLTPLGAAPPDPHADKGRSPTMCAAPPTRSPITSPKV